MLGKKVLKFSKEKFGKKIVVVEKLQYKKEKGKVFGSYVDKSSFFKFFFLFGLFWFFMFIMRSSKMKVSFVFEEMQFEFLFMNKLF